MYSDNNVPRKNKSVAACTLGCKVNAYETEAMLSLFQAAGYDIAEFTDPADIYIINTCTVTNLAGKKSRQMIRRARAANPSAIVVAAGCHAQVSPGEVGNIPGVNLVLGTKDRNGIVAEVEGYTAEQGVYSNVSNIMDQRDFEELAVSKLDNRTRAFIKIQDGCSRFCAYCVIPYARGPVRSRRPEDVLAEAGRLAEAGFKEIVLTGIHVASYGKDLTDANLPALLEEAHNVPGIERIRMSSLEPSLIDTTFVDTLRRLPKICDHFHLSLQSGCDKTLERMNRRYGTEDYERSLSLLRAAFPLVAVTTDIIVGFPGETDADFERSMAFVERMGLSRLHVFPYSPKEGTPAATFTGQVPQDIKNTRCRRMMELGGRLSRQFISAMTGRKMSVLFEQELETGLFEGYTTNYIRVLTRSSQDLRGRVADVVIEGFHDDTASARLL